MKNLNSMKAGLAALAVTTLLWVVPANAQTRSARINIPFEFAAGNNVLPAGQYEVALDPHFARILLRNCKETALHSIGLSMKTGKRTTSDVSLAALRFERYDGTMFLTAAWAPGYVDGRTIRPSEKLVEAMKTSVNGNSTESVTLDSSIK